MGKLELSLVENAFDFFFEAIEHVDANMPQKLKYAVLHLASAMELVLKARLAKEHWAFLFKDPSHAKIDKFEKGDFRSVDFQEVLDRLEGICQLDLTKYKPIFKSLRDMRNRIQHFSFSGDLPEITSILVKTWSFLWDFIHDQIPEEIDDAQDILGEINNRMIKYKAYLHQRLSDIQLKLDEFENNGNLVVECPSCLQRTLAIPGGENPICHFCRYQRDPEVVADDWATRFIGYPHTDPKEHMIDPVLKECPSCYSETMIEFEDSGAVPPDPAWLCFSCGASGPFMMKCGSCGEKFPWEEEVYLCPECRGEKGES